MAKFPMHSVVLVILRHISRAWGVGWGDMQLLNIGDVIATTFLGF